MVDLPQNIIQARDTAQNAAQTAAGIGAAEYSIGDVLKQKLLDLYGNNKDIISGLDTATSGYTSAPATARLKYQDIFNPTQKEALVSQYTGNQSIPMLSLASVLGQRMGRIEDTIGAGTNAYKAYSSVQQANATNLRTLYEDLLNEYTTQKKLEPAATEYKTASAGRTSYMYNPLTGQIVQKVTGPESDNGNDFAKFLTGMGLRYNPQTGQFEPISQQGQTTQSYQEPPMSSPYGKTDAQYEYPQGSGVIWVSDGQGGWK